jgi:BirA family biotin operon repressor/biotin-[acetyl-CoA-carboxylase] ligase
MVEEKSGPDDSVGGLKTRFFGRKALYYPRIESTMDIARREARAGTTEGTVVIAGEQSKGRGRINRSWLTPKGNIALSVVLYPDISQVPYLTMITSLAVTNSIEAITGLKTSIKWPNDILIGRKKVCGILVESELKKKKVVYSIVGVGINVNVKPDIDDASLSATSLGDELEGEILRTDIINRMLFEMERMYLALPHKNSIHQEWQEKLVTLGKRVTVNSGDTILEGIAESVDESGALLLRQAGGGSTRIVAGDVTLRETDLE